jgi:hypothetical protein
LNINDVRGTNKTPNQYDAYRVTTEFNDLGLGGATWHGIMTVRGWDGTYGAWQLASYASAGETRNNIFFRTGDNTTWDSWHTMWHSGNFNPGSYYLASNPNGYTSYSANQAVNTNSSPAFSDLYIGSVIYHSGDTNTYTQFHAADQWRVVTGGSERLEVNNTNTTVNQPLQVNGTVKVGDPGAPTYIGAGTIGWYGTDQNLFVGTGSSTAKLRNLISIKNWSGVLTVSGSTTAAAVTRSISFKRLLFVMSEASGTTVNAGGAIIYYHDGVGEVRIYEGEGTQTQTARYHRRFGFQKASDTSVTILQPYYDYESFSTGSPSNQVATSLSTTIYLHDILIMEA